MLMELEVSETSTMDLKLDRSPEILELPVPGFTGRPYDIRKHEGESLVELVFRQLEEADKHG
jgi:hypothetical protein